MAISVIGGIALIVFCGIETNRALFGDEIMKKVLTKISKKIVVKYPTHLKDLKVGDIVITAELHQIKKIEGRNHITCTEIGEPYPYIKHTGWGQQGLLKVISGVTKL